MSMKCAIIAVKSIYPFSQSISANGLQILGLDVKEDLYPSNGRNDGGDAIWLTFGDATVVESSVASRSCGNRTLRLALRGFLLKVAVFDCERRVYGFHLSESE